MSKIAVIRIRGNFHLSQAMKDSFKHLNLPTKNSCVIIEDAPATMGLVNKVKDYVTWGIIDDATLKLIEKRKTKNDNYRLHPPTKGYGKKGIKVAFKVGGSLGDRKEKINELLSRMV